MLWHVPIVHETRNCLPRARLWSWNSRVALLLVFLLLAFLFNLEDSGQLVGVDVLGSQSGQRRGRKHCCRKSLGTAWCFQHSQPWSSQWLPWTSLPPRGGFGRPVLFGA